jgi:hypothetical protein
MAEKKDSKSPTTVPFEWSVDMNGYYVEEATTVHQRPGNTMLTGRLSYSMLRSHGGLRRWYYPLIEFPALWRTFGDISGTQSGAEEFANSYGWLWRPADGDGIRLEAITTLADIFFRVGAAYDSKDFETAMSILQNDIFVPHLLAQRGYEPMRMRPQFDQVTRGGKTTYEFKPAPLTLLSALIVQASEAAATGGRGYVKCLSCGSYIIHGVRGKTARREYCKRSCKQAAWRRRAKEKQRFVAEAL